MATFKADPLDYEAIRITLATYAVALDTKNFALLEDVFTEDVETIYPFKGEIKGRQNVADAIEKRLTPVTTQHALTTQLIELGGDGEAKALTYFTGVHFGKGKWEGKEVTAWGRYEDVLTKGPDTEGRKKWLVRRRKVLFTKRLGEEGVMDGE